MSYFQQHNPDEVKKNAAQSSEFSEETTSARLDKDVWELKQDGVIIVSSEKMKKLRAEGMID